MNISIENKKKEAIRRMKLMGVFPETVRQFERDDYISRSEPPFGAFYWVEGEELEAIRKFEKENDALVYMVIRCYFKDLGMMDSYLYVSDYEEDWCFVDSDLKDGYVDTYTVNYAMPDFSEFGAICYKMGMAAGPVRIG